VTTLLEFWYAILAVFNNFDPITYAIMAIIVVGAGLMMPNITSLITVTVAALMIFAFALFARTALAAKDAASLARSDWNDFLALPLHTVFLYACVFAVAITIIHAIRSLAKH
jgi:hypothetical protein